MTNEDFDMLCSMANAVNAAVEAEAERRYLEKDRDYWKEKYQELLNGSLREAQQTTGMLLSAVLAGVTLGSARGGEDEIEREVRG